MKTPEDIKKGLSYCANDSCLECPYDLGLRCGDEVMHDALAYIQQLEEEVAQKKSRISELESRLMKSYEENLYSLEMVDAGRKLSDSYADRLAQVERERNAAVYDINRCCGTCKHFQNEEDDCTAEECIGGGSYMEPSGWQWRGVCEGNAKEK